MFAMKYLAVASLVIFITASACAQSEDVRSKNYNVKKGIAIEGYDPVSYFNNKPEEGKPEITWVYRGVSYRFANTANYTAFKSRPDKYEPAFGGWCAYAMGANGEKVKIDPETYKIKDGKLYLFYNFWGNNTLSTWNSNEPALKTKAEQNWKKFVP